MTITMTSTPYLVRMEGISCRVWDGITGDGVAVKVFVDSIITSPVPGYDALVLNLLSIPGPQPRMVQIADIFQG